MPMGGPPGKSDFKKPKNAKKTFGRILKYMGKNKVLLLVVVCFVSFSAPCAASALRIA